MQFLDLHPKKEIFLFDSFGFEGSKEFILKNDQKVLNKILYGIEKFNKKDNKITLITLKFSMQEYEKIKNINKYGKKHKIKIGVIVHLVDDQLK